MAAALKKLNKLQENSDNSMKSHTKKYRFKIRHQRSEIIKRTKQEFWSQRTRECGGKCVYHGLDQV